MKKYYAGRKQSNGEYVYVSELHPELAHETTNAGDAIAYDNADAALNLAEIATITSGTEYAGIEIETTIKEL